MPKLRVHQDLIDFFYPIGTIYMTRNASFDPNKQFGGSWNKISGGYLYSDSSSIEDRYLNTGKQTRNHTLTVNEMPSHNHWLVTNGTGSEQGYRLYGATMNAKDVSTGDANAVRPTGGNQGHSHEIPTMGVFLWRRIS